MPSEQSQADVRRANPGFAHNAARPPPQALFGSLPAALRGELGRLHAAAAAAAGREAVLLRRTAALAAVDAATAARARGRRREW
jgi:RecB family exonuclease